MSKRICVLGDMHAPCVHPKAWDALRQVKKDFKPEIVVSIGDLVDGYNFSKYTKDHDAPNIKQELRTVKDQIKRLAEIFPEIFVCYGNHDLRQFKRGLEVGLPKLLFKTLNEVIGAPETFRWADHWEFEKTYFCHGEDKQDLRRSVLALNMNLVVGHAHSKGGEIVHVNTGKKVLWGANAGAMINHESYAFRYTKSHEMKAVNGILLIEDNTPIFSTF
jgi:predicted phosphodiesterase